MIVRILLTSSGSKLPLFLPPGTTPPKAPSPLRLSLSTLLASGAALGHASSALAPAYLPYTYGTRSGLSIIDLDQTLPMLRRTAALVRDLVKADGVLMIVGSRAGHVKALRRAREKLGDSAFVVEEWMPGTLTNSVTL
jgi:small subunit ribosomal protein S2